MPVPTENTKILDVRYAAGKVYVIYRTYIKESETMTLNYETVSSAGVVSTSGKEFFSRKTDRYEFIDFDITNNSSNTKIAIKTTYKASKDDQYKTDFVLFDAVTQKIAWTKTVPKYLKRSNPWFVWSFKAVESTGFLGFILNENDDIYYAFNEKLKKDDKKTNVIMLQLRF